MTYTIEQKNGKLCKKRKYKDITGLKFGKLTISSFSHYGKNKDAWWNCICECGKEIICRSNSIQRGDNKTCGKIECKINNIQGKKFGHLSVIELEQTNPIKWKCKCDCGKIIITTMGNLKNGQIQCEMCSWRIYDLTGKRFGNLVVLSINGVKNHNMTYLCQCDCGERYITSGKGLKAGTSSCGKSIHKIDNIQGKKFGMLTAINFVSVIRGDARWKCKCDCGKIGIWAACDLKRDGIKSCGCSTEKIRQETCLKIYGVKNPIQNQDVAKKNAKSQSNSYIRYHWNTGEQLICQGGWEEKVVRYLNINKINFRWQSKTFTMPNGKTYRPDLYLFSSKKWIEIKGFFRPDAKKKWKWFKKEHTNSELWDFNKLKEMKIL